MMLVASVYIMEQRGDLVHVLQFIVMSLYYACFHKYMKPEKLAAWSVA